MKKNNRGFTLIELLVVMFIIAILSGISIFGIEGARKSARDSRRKSDLETIRSALEMYRADCRAYPASLGTAIKDTGADTCFPAGQEYLTAVPKDPKDPYPAYTYTSTGATYSLSADLENPVTTYTVYNP